MGKKEKEEHHQGSGSWIPTFILEDKKLDPTDKIVYAMIVNLSNKRGYCWATNKWFADHMAVSQSSISRSVARLEKAKLIVSFYEITKTGRERRLKVDHPITGYSHTEQDPSSQIDKGVSSDRLHHTNIVLSKKESTKLGSSDFPSFQTTPPPALETEIPEERITGLPRKTDNPGTFSKMPPSAITGGGPRR